MRPQHLLMSFKGSDPLALNRDLLIGRQPPPPPPPPNRGSTEGPLPRFAVCPPPPPPLPLLHRHTIQGSVLDVLYSSGVKWMRSMFIDDIIASHSDNILDIPTLAMTLKSNETYKTNVAVQVLPSGHFFSQASWSSGRGEHNPCEPFVSPSPNPNRNPQQMKLSLSSAWTRSGYKRLNEVVHACMNAGGPGPRRELCKEERHPHPACPEAGGEGVGGLRWGPPLQRQADHDGRRADNQVGSRPMPSHLSLTWRVSCPSTTHTHTH